MRTTEDTRSVFELDEKHGINANKFPHASHTSSAVCSQEACHLFGDKFVKYVNRLFETVRCRRTWMFSIFKFNMSFAETVDLNLLKTANDSRNAMRVTPTANAHRERKSASMQMHPANGIISHSIREQCNDNEQKKSSE